MYEILKGVFLSKDSSYNSVAKNKFFLESVYKKAMWREFTDDTFAE